MPLEKHTYLSLSLQCEAMCQGNGKVRDDSPGISNPETAWERSALFNKSHKKTFLLKAVSNNNFNFKYKNKTELCLHQPPESLYARARRAKSS
jgi:hypothetical protein